MTKVRLFVHVQWWLVVGPQVVPNGPRDLSGKRRERVAQGRRLSLVVHRGKHRKAEVQCRVIMVHGIRGLPGVISPWTPARYPLCGIHRFQNPTAFQTRTGCPPTAVRAPEPGYSDGPRGKTRTPGRRDPRSHLQRAPPSGGQDGPDAGQLSDDFQDPRNARAFGRLSVQQREASDAMLSSERYRKAHAGVSEEKALCRAALRSACVAKAPKSASSKQMSYQI